MKREQLIEECQKNKLDDTGKVAELRERIKAFRQRQNSVDDLFKNYEQSISTNEQ